MKSHALRVAAIAAVVVAAALLAWRFVPYAGAVAPSRIAEGEVSVLITGPGTLQARVPVTLSALVSAQVVALHADHGDTVKRGQLLAVLDDRDLAARRAAAAAGRDGVERNIVAAQATLEKSLADLELARNRERRDLDLNRAGFISQAGYEASMLGLRAASAAKDNAAAVLAARVAESRAVAEDARYADALWSRTRILSPLDALVIQRSVEVGSTVSPGATLFRLVDPATLWVAVRIDEAQVGRITEGMRARIRLRNGEEVGGHVARISRQSDAATRELDVYVAFDSPPARFAIDQEAEVSIAAGVARGPAVPIGALVRVRGQEGAMVVRAGRKEFRPLTIVARDARLAVVAAGLEDVDGLAPWTSH